MTKYSKYKASGIDWFPLIPEHWQVIKLGRIGGFSASGIDKKSDISELPVRMVNYTDVYGNATLEIRSSDSLMETTTTAEKINEHVLKKGDILFTPSSETVEDIGLSAVVTEDLHNTVYSYHLIRLRTSERFNLDLGFKKYFCNVHEVLSQFSKACKGTTRQILGRDDFKDILILLPPASEQKTIAVYLDRKTAQIDGLIAKKERMIELLKEERTAIINQVVTKGLNPKAEMKDSDIDWFGKIPKHWEVKRLKYVVNINPQRPDGISDEAKVVFIAMESMNVDGTYDDSIVRSYSEVKSGFTYFAEGDVIFAKITPCFENGKGTLLCNLGTPIGFGSTEFHVLRAVKNKTIPEYLYFLTISGLFRGLGEAFMQGVAGQKRVTNDFVQDFIFGVPPVDEQETISAYLEEKIKRIDTQIGRENKSIEYLKKYRTSLISEVVTGKIDVRGRV